VLKISNLCELSYTGNRLLGNRLLGHISITSSSSNVNYSVNRMKSRTSKINYFRFPCRRSKPAVFFLFLQYIYYSLLLQTMHTHIRNKTNTSHKSIIKQIIRTSIQKYNMTPREKVDHATVHGYWIFDSIGLLADLPGVRN